MSIHELDTPFLMLDLDQLDQNIAQMAQFAANHGLHLRPHVKTHKCPAIARRQQAKGATGFTVAKLGEAEVLADHGLQDLFIAYPVIGEKKIRRLLQLAKRTEVRTIVDNEEGAAALSRAFTAAGMKLTVRIKVDTGMGRCGVLPGKPTLHLAQKIVKMPALHFEGITTHAGHIYGTANREEQQRIGLEEGRLMVQTAELLRANGIPVSVVSVGSTPSVTISGKVKGVTEIRPGNYVFYDAMQVGLGVATWEQCALKVVTQVISHPTPHRALIDGGSKTFCLDQGAHGLGFMKGYGYVVKRPDATLERLSEEHGFLQLDPKQGPLKLGEYLEVIPNHACTVVNNFEEIHVFQKGTLVDVWPIAARGRLQ